MKTGKQLIDSYMEKEFSRKKEESSDAGSDKLSGRRKIKHNDAEAAGKKVRNTGLGVAALGGLGIATGKLGERYIKEIKPEAARAVKKIAESNRPKLQKELATNIANKLGSGEISAKLVKRGKTVGKVGLGLAAAGVLTKKVGKSIRKNRARNAKIDAKYNKDKED